MISVIFFCDDEGNGTPPKNKYIDFVLNQIEKKGEVAIIKKMNNFACLYNENEGIEIDGIKEYKNIKEIIRVEEVKTDIEILKQCATEWANRLNGESFVVRVSRRGNHRFTSVELEKDLGAVIWKISKCDVDLKTPQKTYRVFIQDNRTFVSV